MKIYSTNLHSSFLSILSILTLLLFSSPSFANLSFSKLENSKSFTFNSNGNDKAGYINTQLSQASAPSSSPSTGTYTGTQLVTITSASSGVNIRYTTDGSDPSSTNGTLYSGGPVSISSNTTLKSIAYGTGYTDSQVITETYIINCETPVLTPSTGTYDAGQRVTMSSATTGAKIYYTTDGSQPTTSSTLYSSRITLTGGNTTIRAIAIMNGLGNSEITTETYNILLPVAVPTFTPTAGTYNALQNVAITSATSGTTIYYTTDGSTPTTSSTVYSGPVSVGTNLTIKAIAVKSGMTNSTVSSSDYVILLPVAAPTFAPPAGTYNTVQSVAITSTTQGATIYYTTDGTAPTTSSPVYNGPVAINATSTLKAFAVKTGMSNSPVSSADYSILLPTAAPTFTPPAGTYNSALNVTIASATPNALIYYTTDGSTPTTSSLLYTGAINIGTNLTLKAIAVKTGMSDSPVSSANYIILLPVSAPTFSPSAGTYSTAQSVTITSATPGVSIYYTTDGSVPTTSSTLYTTPINIGVNTALNALAVKSGMSNSPITTGNYVIQLPAAAPTFTPPAGTYNSIQSVAITSTTQGATIYYTTDGSTPTSSSPVYTGPITISSSSDVKAIAEKSGMSDSPITIANYVIVLSAATPTFSPAAGNYTAAQTVTIASATPGAIIYYTTDGSIPTSSSQLYNGPLNIGATAILNAIAVKNGMNNSLVNTGNYIIQLQAEDPVFNIPSGNYNTAKSIIITTPTQGATIYYSTDGTTPTTSSLQYNGPIIINESTTLKAIAIITGMTNSNVTTATYTIQLPKTANPTFSPAPGSFTTPQTITITDATVGSTIKYTTDGSAPSQTNGIIYTAPIALSASATLKAIAYIPGLSDSDVIDATYTITLGNADSDGDGISDVDDEYPLDPVRTINNLFPATGFGSLAFEDNWPSKADYDMNDMVIDYQFNQVTNAKNEVVEIKARFVLRAMGTSLHNGFGIELPVAPSQVSNCVVKLQNGNAVPFGNIVSINSKGLEESNNPKAIVILFDDGFKLFPQNTPETAINTLPEIAWTKPDTLNMTISFVQPISMSEFAESLVYNPFIFTNKTRSTEIHLPNYAPTSLANTNLFNTGEDDYNPQIGKYYKTSKNLPWALNIYEGYAYPIEKASIIDAFIHFAEWAQSDGALYPDWYQLKDGYRKSNIIYTHQ